LARDLPETRQNLATDANGKERGHWRRNWGDLRLRLASAAVLAPVAFGCIWLGGLAWAVLICACTIGLMFEWAQLCGLPLSLHSGAAPCVLVVLSAVVALFGWSGAAIVLLALGATLALLHSQALAVGTLYIGLPCLALIWLRADPIVGRANILLLILVVWATDIGAYLAGRWLGGAKLAPRISPGKTWSGAAGGLVAAILVGLANAPKAAMIAAALSLVAQAGDLLESGIKRHFNVKDSGRLIPGHGGLLDRLDGVLAAAILAAALAFAKGRGVLIWL
jgi:phosphatidate cytidylyltransferase